MFAKYLFTVSPKLRPAYEKDSVTQLYHVCNCWSHFMGLREFLYPEILCTMASYNALRCARLALKGGAPFRGRRADPNGRHGSTHLLRRSRDLELSSYLILAALSCLLMLSRLMRELVSSSLPTLAGTVRNSPAMFP